MKCSELFCVNYISIITIIGNFVLCVYFYSVYMCVCSMYICVYVGYQSVWMCEMCGRCVFYVYLYVYVYCVVVYMWVCEVCMCVYWVKLLNIVLSGVGFPCVWISLWMKTDQSEPVTILLSAYLLLYVYDTLFSFKNFPLINHRFFSHTI